MLLSAAGRPVGLARADLLHRKHIAHLTTPTQGGFCILKMSFGLCSKNLAENHFRTALGREINPM
jgi:hypothetical protein